jgi:predicted dehydrogenase
MDEFASIIIDGKQPAVAVKGTEGLQDMRIIDAIYTAARTGKKIKL